MGNVVSSPKISLSTWTASSAEFITITGTNSATMQEEHYLVEIEISATGKQSWKATVAVTVPATTSA